MGRRFTLAILAVALLTSGVMTTAAQAKPGVVQAQAGAIHPKSPDGPFEYLRFYPSNLKVHRGQTVQWKILGFHTVTFSKAGRTGFFRADELPGTYAFPEATIFGTGCGVNGKICSVDAKSRFVGSGAPFTFEKVDFKIDLPPGKYKYFCQIHGAMTGGITVVGKSAPVPTQRQINKQIASEVRADTGAVDALHKADQRPVSTVGADGVRTWRVLVGDTTPGGHVQIIGYLPATLAISAGDRVQFQMRDRFVGDPHTVTFPTELAGGFEPVPHGLAPFANYPSCDPDGPTTGVPGVAGQWSFVGPDCPASLEFMWAPWMLNANRAPGDAVLTPATYHDSGTLFGPRLPKNFRTLPDTGRTFPSGFSAEFPAPGAFSFECNIHAEFMTGSVEVS